MKRLSVGVVLMATALVVATCKPLQVNEPRDLSVSAWSTEGRTPQRLNVAVGAIVPPLREVWQFDVEAGFGATSPLIVGNAVLVATRQGYVYGIDIRTGDGLGSEEFGDAIEGTPAVADGVLVVPVEWGGRAVIGYDLQRARRRWAHRGPAVHAGVVVTHDLAIVADDSGAIVAFEVLTGTEAWRNEKGASPVYAGLAATDSHYVAVADEEGTIRMLDARDGEERWTHALEQPVLATPAIDDGHLFVGTTRGTLAAFDAETGRQAWRADVAGPTTRLTSPAVADGRVYVAATDGVVRAFEADSGTLSWKADVDEAVVAPPLVVGDVVYVGTLGRRLIALAAATGEEQWDHEVRGRIKSPMAARGRQLVVLSEPRHVYLFEPEAGYATVE